MSDIRFNRWLHQSGTGGVYQDSSGRVGIGTSVPTTALDVQSGTIKIGNNTLSSSGVSTFSSGPVLVGSGTSTGTASQSLQVTGGAYVSGNLGIGTTNPIVSTHIAISTSGTALKLNNTLGGLGSYIDLDFDTYSTAQVGYANAPASIRVIDDGVYSGHISFRTKGASIGASQTEKVRITSSGSVGIGSTIPVKPLDVRGEATFGSGITISDLSWGKDTNQLVYTFSGTAGGANPSDGVIALVSPNANPSATRIGSLVYGNKVSGTTATTNPGLKAGIDCTTNTNVANAADTGAYITFYTKPDNANFRSQMTLNSNGVLTKPYQPAFLAYRNSTLSVTTTWQNISQGILTEAYDVGPVYSTSTNGRFVAPVAGKYMFYAGGYSVGSTSGERYGFGVKVNNLGSPDFITGGNYCITDSPLTAYQVVLNLNVNDYVELWYFSAISTTLGGPTHWLYWGGYLLG